MISPLFYMSIEKNQHFSAVAETSKLNTGSR